jgi:hypothetical protein
MVGLQSFIDHRHTPRTTAQLGAHNKDHVSRDPLRPAGSGPERWRSTPQQRGPWFGRVPYQAIHRPH